MNIYKAMLNTIVKPLTNHSENELRALASRFKQTSGVEWATGEMLERAINYIIMTVALAKETKNEHKR